MLRKGILFLFILINSHWVLAQNRALWATVWDISSAQRIDQIIKTAKQYHFNQLFIQVRYRADALYFPNKIDSTYPNPEPRCYIFKNSNFDPLQYAIEQGHKNNIEIHAWVTTFVVTPHDLTKIDSNHLYYKHPEWIKWHKNGSPMLYNEHEGAFLDPGIIEVQDYLRNVIGDIATNYRVDGIQLDYIRYPDSLYGFNPLALKAFENSNESNFTHWKQNQITDFVKSVHELIHQIDSNMLLSVAVFANQNKAINRLSQNWVLWQKKANVDHVYVMAYNTSNGTFLRDVRSFHRADANKTTVIVRAWKDNKPYPVSQINEKIRILKHMGYTNIGYYSYSGLISNQYLPKILF